MSPFSTARIELIVIGNEILSGSIPETNSVCIGQNLITLGHRLRRITITGDTVESIGRSVERALDEMDIVILTGGLGPTRDDITREALADVTGKKLVLDENLLASIRKKFQQRRLDMPPINEKQAYLPEGARPLENDAGIAPGIFLTMRDKPIFALPGVPEEMKWVFEHEVAERLRSLYPSPEPEIITLCTTGIRESKVAEIIESLDLPEGEYEIASLPAPTGVDLHLIFHGKESPGKSRERKRIIELIQGTFGEHVYSAMGQTLEEVVGEILHVRELTLSVAESCTGGLISHRITAVPGSSDYFVEGLVTYSNQAKVDLLGVDLRDIIDYGAVSRKVALDMARGAQQREYTDIGIGVTGIAGPSGGTEEKPVGTVYMAIVGDGFEYTEDRFFAGDRSTIKLKASQAALDMIRKYVPKHC